jgi:hypothetical protein
MSNKPTHLAHVVADPKEGSERKAQWHQVGAVWPHRNGNGFDLMIPAGISVARRVVCVERMDEQQGNAMASPDQRRGFCLAHGRVCRTSPHAESLPPWR